MKKIISLFLVLFVLFSSALMTSAQGEYVVDDADLLTEDMEATLLSEISSIQKNYGIDIVLHTTMSIGYEDIHSYSENFYLTNGYGEDGLVFVINLNNNEVGNRDFYTYYQGTVYDTFGDEAYNSDYGFVNQNILPYLANEDYYEAFHTYLKVTFDFVSGNYYNFNSDSYPNYEDQYQSGEYWENDYYTDGAVVTYPSNSMSPVIKELIVIAIAGIVAFVIVSFMKSKMNTAVIKTEASDYVKSGSLKITRQFDVFTHRHVTRTAKPKNNSSSGGRSGGSIGGGGGGRSGGGGGKF